MRKLLDRKQFLERIGSADSNTIATIIGAPETPMPTGVRRRLRRGGETPEAPTEGVPTSVAPEFPAADPAEAELEEVA